MVREDAGEGERMGLNPGADEDEYLQLQFRTWTLVTHLHAKRGFVNLGFICHTEVLTLRSLMIRLRRNTHLT